MRLLSSGATFALALGTATALAAPGAIKQQGEVLILQGDDETTTADGAGKYGVRDLAAIARRVIQHAGDNFQFITVWLTFPDKDLPAGWTALERNVKNDVQGIGMAITDYSAAFGSRGVLRSVLNMGRNSVPGAVGPQVWPMSLWGQESAHRWLLGFRFIDARSGKSSDALLGRDCAHYSRFVESQASVLDGLAWTDNGDGSFTWTAAGLRYGNLDLYGMGLLAADEMPSFFLIEDIPGYTTPRCSSYNNVARPMAQTVTGTRVDVTIDSIIEANGERIPSADDTPGYSREAIVLLSRPTETPESVSNLGDRLNLGRVWWEEWNQTASNRRQVICTQISQDCGDPRSDVVRLDVKPNVGGSVVPQAGPVTVEVEVKNTGGRPTTGVKATLEFVATPPPPGGRPGGGGMPLSETRDIGGLPVGDTSVQTFHVNLGTVACGTELLVKAYTQSDFHYHRKRQAILAGVETKQSDGFEADSGWRVDPDATDTSKGARWERAKPARNVLLTRTLQPEGGHAGDSAWVTGAAAGYDTWVKEGRTTLESPEYDAAALRDPLLRYWVSFAGYRSDGIILERSPEASLIVQAREAGGAWREIDRLENADTRGWRQRTVRLPAAVTEGKLRLRFVAEDRAAMLGAVEAAIDDIEVTSNLPQCYPAPPDAAADEGADGSTDPKPDPGCGCRSPSPDPGAGLLPGVLLLAAGLRRRRS